MAGSMMSVSAMAVCSGLHAPGHAAGIVSMAARIRTPGQTAGMIPMAVVGSVGITVYAVVHMGSSFGTARNIAAVMAVLSGQCTSVNSAGPVNMRVFQAAPGQPAGMIPMAVACSVGITVYAVVHMGSGLGTVRNIASVMAVLTGQCTPVDSAKAMLVLFRLGTFRNHAGNAYLTFLRCIFGFQGTFIDRIGNNAACYHGNRYKCNG